MCYMRSTTTLGNLPVRNTGTSQEVTGTNEDRIGLTLCSHNVVTITYSFETPAVLGRGITLAPGMHSVHLSREQYGSCITRPLQAISSAANGTPALVLEITEVKNGDT